MHIRNRAAGRVSRVGRFWVGALLALAACRAGDERQVVIYTSVDQHYSEPVLNAFQKESGIRVLAVYDVEAAKTTGLVNRLIAERARPQADVFWSGEVAQTLLLKDKGVLAPYRSPAAETISISASDPDYYYTNFAGRARIIIVNTRLLLPENYPTSIRDLLDPRWPGEKIAIANPLFGTTNTHAAALYALWGPEAARRFFENVKGRGVQVVAGNSVVRDMVADGRALWGVTDTDDAAAALSRKFPVAVVFPDQDTSGPGTLCLPNSVALIAGAPHPTEGQALIDYLLSPDVEARLVESGWSHIPVRKINMANSSFCPPNLKRMDVNFNEAYKQFARMRDDLSEIFLK